MLFVTNCLGIFFSFLSVKCDNINFPSKQVISSREGTNTSQGSLYGVKYFNILFLLLQLQSFFPVYDEVACNTWSVKSVSRLKKQQKKTAFTVFMTGARGRLDAAGAAVSSELDSIFFIKERHWRLLLVEKMFLFQPRQEQNGFFICWPVIPENAFKVFKCIPPCCAHLRACKTLQRNRHTDRRASIHFPSAFILRSRTNPYCRQQVGRYLYFNINLGDDLKKVWIHPGEQLPVCGPPPWPLCCCWELLTYLQPARASAALSATSSTPSAPRLLHHCLCRPRQLRLHGDHYRLRSMKAVLGSSNGCLAYH